MSANFDETHQRFGTDCLKWDGAETQFGAPDLLPLWVADMDFRVPEPVLLALQKRIEHGILGYYYPPAQLVQSIIDWWRARHSFSIDPSWVVQSPGVVPSLSLAVRMFTAPGDKVLIQTPVYPPFFNVIEKNGRQVVQNPLYVHQDRYAIVEMTTVPVVMESTSVRMPSIAVCSTAWMSLVACAIRSPTRLV